MGYLRADKLLDPLTGTVTSGQRANVDLGPDVSGIMIKRLASSAGTMQFVAASQADGEPSGNTTGYTLTSADWTFGPLPVDAIRWVRIYASGGAVDYEITRLKRA